MKSIFKKLYSSDVLGAEYAECNSGGASGCASIHIKELSLYYGAEAAFKDISISFPPCEVSALVGPSGCGKTSFLQCLNRLSDLFPTARVEGEVQIGTMQVYPSVVDVVKLRRRVGMIFQKPSPFPFSIRKNFHLALREHGVRSVGERDHRMEETLRGVGLWSEVKDRLDSNAQTLSGGQQQRLCIARALALEPEVLLMDEPCSALDPISSSAVEELISSLRGKYTVILVTHNLAQARRLADFTAFFWLRDGSGCLIEEGETEQIFEAPQSEITRAYVSGLSG